MTQSLIEQFIILWVVIDPIGTIPVFIAVTARVEPSRRWKVALDAVLVATGVLMFFLVAGQFLIDALGISLVSFQIAGGLVLFLFALTMIFGDSKPAKEAGDVRAGRQEASPAVFPLAVPSLASPGAMLAIVLLTDNNGFSIGEQAVTAALMLAVIAIAFLLMLAAGPILKVIRVSGAEVISRVMGLVLASVAVDNVIAAFIELLRTTEI
ncbi:MAG: MarC family protein [Proteobacteria bacterium]|nr:MarC family protein [Pseudomonadota bacterium]